MSQNLQFNLWLSRGKPNMSINKLKRTYATKIFKKSTIAVVLHVLDLTIFIFDCPKRNLTQASTNWREDLQPKQKNVLLQWCTVSQNLHPKKKNSQLHTVVAVVWCVSELTILSLVVLKFDYMVLPIFFLTINHHICAAGIHCWGEKTKNSIFNIELLLKKLPENLKKINV